MLEKSAQTQIKRTEKAGHNGNLCVRPLFSNQPVSYRLQIAFLRASPAGNRAISANPTGGANEIFEINGKTKHEATNNIPVFSLRDDHG
jgi:hypothetical protein